MEIFFKFILFHLIYRKTLCQILSYTKPWYLKEHFKNCFDWIGKGDYFCFHPQHILYGGWKQNSNTHSWKIRRVYICPNIFSQVIKSW